MVAFTKLEILSMTNAIHGKPLKCWVRVIFHKNSFYYTCYDKKINLDLCMNMNMNMKK